MAPAGLACRRVPRPAFGRRLIYLRSTPARPEGCTRRRMAEHAQRVARRGPVRAPGDRMPQVRRNAGGAAGRRGQPVTGWRTPGADNPAASAREAVKSGARRTALQVAADHAQRAVPTRNASRR